MTQLMTWPPGQVDAPTDDKAPENTGDDQSREQQSDGVWIMSRKIPVWKCRRQSSNVPELQDLPATDAGVGADAGFDHGADNGVGPASPTSPFETAQTAYDRGYADGVVAGREAAEAELRATIEAEFEG